METASQGSGHEPAVVADERQPGFVWLVVIWGRVVVGLGLGAIAGVSFGHAWTSEKLSMWFVGAISLLAAVLLVLSALYARKGAVPAGRGPEPAVRPVAPGERLVPLLGALLVYKYQLISHQQLAAAIAEQKRSKKRIGEILMQMGLITETQLREALEYQQSFKTTPEQQAP